MFQEEHTAAQGFIRLIAFMTKQQYSKVVWSILKDVIIDYVENKGYINDENKQKRQANIFSDLIENFDKTVEKAGINVDENGESSAIIVSEFLFQYEAYVVIKKFSELHYDTFANIVNTKDFNFNKNTSYKNNKKSRNVSRLPYDAKKSQIEDFIASNIMSNPKKIKTLLYQFENFLAQKRTLTSDEQTMYAQLYLLTETDLKGLNPEDFSNRVKEVEREFFNKYQYSFRLSMDWLVKLLSFFKIKDDKTQQNIIVSVEYPIIILGMFFPKIRSWFVSKHLENIDDKLSQLEEKTDAQIKNVLGVSVDEIKNMSFAGRTLNIIKILADVSVKAYNKAEHLNANGIIVDTAEILDNAERIKSTVILKAVISLMLLSCVFVIHFFHFGMISFIFLIFPISSAVTTAFAYAPYLNNKIYKGEKTETYYYSNIPEEDYDYSDGSGLDVTVQIPVYKESNDVIFRTINQSIDACNEYAKKSAKSANIIVSDDGLAFLLGEHFYKDGIEELLQMPYSKLSQEQQQAVQRIKFYRENNISFVARPKDNRAGKFKKASNLNYTYDIVDKVQKGDQSDIPADAIYEGNSVYIGDVILMLDKDSELHKDVISVTVPKFIKDKKLAFTQNLTKPSNYSDNYFSKVAAVFTTFLYKQIFSQSAISGSLVPFVGHNGFIRKDALDEIGRWPENRVSEDFYMSTTFFTKGYHGKYLAFEGYEFGEMVSRSYLEEFSKISRYVFGMLELIFKKNANDEGKGILTDWFKNFMASKDVTFTQKINFFVYPLSYVNLIFVMPSILLSLASGSIFLLSSNIITAILIVPFFSIFYKSYKATDGTDKDESILKSSVKIVASLVAISLMFMSFSLAMIKSLRMFIFNYDKTKSFSATNVDDDNYSLKEAVSTLKNFFENNKSFMLLFIPFGLIVTLKKPVFDIAFVMTMLSAFSFFIMALTLSPFFVYQLREKITGLFKTAFVNVNVVFAELATDDYSIKEIPKVVNVFVSNNLDDFNSADFINTGLKIKGKTVWQIKDDNRLIFVADGISAVDTVKALNKSRKLNKRIKEILNLKKGVNIKINSAILCDQNAEDIFFEDGIVTVKSQSYINAVNGILKAVAVSYAKKAVISLVSVSDKNLYQALANGSARKMISEQQFKYLKENFAKEGKDIFKELYKLRQNGTEIYIVTDSKRTDLSDYAISGYICDGKMFDFWTQEETEINRIKQKISAKEFEKLMIYSENPFIIELDMLQEILSGNNIIDTYGIFDTLIGNIKIRFGLKNMTLNDIKMLAYNIDIENIPSIKDYEIKGMLNADIDDFFAKMKVAQNDAVGIIIGDTKISDEYKEAFLEIIKERILAKHSLEKYGKESGLEDKNLEIMLGKLLKIQATYKDKTIVLDELGEFKGNQQDMIKKLNEIKPLISNKNPAVVNTMIELILAYSQEVKRDIVKEEKVMTVEGYRKMLSAA